MTAVWSGSFTTHYEYDKDRRLTRIDRPEGTSVTLGYETSPNSGRLSRLTMPRGSTTLHWAAATGLLDSIRSPDGVTVAYWPCPGFVDIFREAASPT